MTIEVNNSHSRNSIAAAIAIAVTVVVVAKDISPITKINAL
jgi:hypothetical protein